ncbi:MAG: N-acetylglucosamine-6-phosphate deacetylase [Bacteroidota bacterium]
MNTSYAIVADKIFTGEDWLINQAVVIKDNIISQIIPAQSLDPAIPAERFSGCMAAPAFIDLQIYGASQKLFSVFPEPDALARLNNYCRSGGAAFFMPTVATNSTEVFHKCIDAIREYWAHGGQGVLGLHVEGPWINAAKKGAHIESYIHSPDLKEVKELLEYGKEVIKIITLAPEVCSKEIVEYILSQNIVVSAGHSNATYDQAMEGFANGIPIATHLYNAMSPLQHRAPGLLGAIFDHDKVKASIIPDGHHVDFAAIRIAKQLMKERLFVITDAVTETNSGHYQHKFVGDKYESDGILSGSALTMNKAVRNLVNFANVDLAEALRMCSLYPAQVINRDHPLGKIEKGFNASIVVLNEELNVVKLF